MTVGTLGLAIGVNAGMFSVVNTVLLNPLPYANADRLVHIAASAPGSDLPAEFGVAPEFFLHYKEQSKLLEDLSTFNSFTATMRAGDRVERIRMSQPTNSLFTTLGAKPILGRLPVAADEIAPPYQPCAVDVVVRRRPQRDRHSRTTSPATTRTVVGVMGPEFKFPTDEHDALDLQRDPAGRHHARPLRRAARRRA